MGEKRYRKAMDLGRKELMAEERPELSKKKIAKRLNSLSVSVEKILGSQESSGAWMTLGDRFKKKMPEGVRWNGQYEIMDRISSSVFNRNVAVLCEYIELSEQLSAR